jgi:hypothetical protein
MSVWQTALGMNVSDNPLTDSPYIDQMNIGANTPLPPIGKEILTEGGVFILTEGATFLDTE